MTWDPKTYLAFHAERTRPAADLLARVPLEAPAKIADLGCGPGNSTALLAARWPHAHIDGIDSSPHMLESARQSGVPADWILADLAKWQTSERYTLLFSNATLQWLPNHAQLLPQILGHLAPGGVVAMQMPRNFHQPSYTLMHRVAEGQPWQHKFAAVRDVTNVLAPEDYFALLEPYCEHIDVWETAYIHVLSGEDAVFHWFSGTGLRPFSEALNETEREDFLTRYREAVAQAYPRRPSGVTLLPFRRLFFVAHAR